MISIKTIEQQWQKYIDNLSDPNFTVERLEEILIGSISRGIINAEQATKIFNMGRIKIEKLRRNR